MQKQYCLLRSWPSIIIIVPKYYWPPQTAPLPPTKVVNQQEQTQQRWRVIIVFSVGLLYPYCMVHTRTIIQRNAPTPYQIPIEATRARFRYRISRNSIAWTIKNDHRGWEETEIKSIINLFISPNSSDTWTNEWMNETTQIIFFWYVIYHGVFFSKTTIYSHFFPFYYKRNKIRK